MSSATTVRRLCRVLVAVTLPAAMQACAQEQPAPSAQAADSNSVEEASAALLASQFRLVENWARLPDGVVWGQAIAVDMDADGNLYVFHRCSADTCVDRSEPPLLKFNPSGELLMSWGEGLFVYPHGLDVDREGNVWVTDARHEGGKGEVVIKFSPKGEVLMTIGTPGVAGNGPYTLRRHLRRRRGRQWRHLCCRRPYQQSRREVRVRWHVCHGLGADRRGAGRFQPAALNRARLPGAGLRCGSQ